MVFIQHCFQLEQHCFHLIQSAHQQIVCQIWSSHTWILTILRLFQSIVSILENKLHTVHSFTHDSTYTPYATSSKEQTGDVITFTQFEEGNLISENCSDTESGDKSNSESIMMSEEDMEILINRKNSMMTL